MIITIDDRYEDSEEEQEERGEMLCDNMMTPYSLHQPGQDPRQDSLARISSMTNSISPPLNSHGSLSPGNNKQARILTILHVDISLPFEAAFK